MKASDLFCLLPRHFPFFSLPLPDFVFEQMKGLLAWNQERKTCCPKDTKTRKSRDEREEKEEGFSHKVKTIDEDSQSETEKIRKEGAAMGRFRNRFLKKIQADV